MEELSRNSATASFVWRSTVSLRISFQTLHEQESANSRAGKRAHPVGEQREMPCWACRNLVKIVAGHQELEMVFVAQEELVVSDFVRFAAAAALVVHSRKDVVDPLLHAVDLKRKCARKVQADSTTQASNCAPHPDFKLKSNRKHAQMTF